MISSAYRWTQLGGHQDSDAALRVSALPFLLHYIAIADLLRLHPLAVEDALRSSNSPRSKLDFYRNHLYLQILIHHMHESDGVEVAKAADALADGKIDEIVIADDDDDEPSKGSRARKPNNTSSTWSLPEGVEGVFEPSVAGTRLQGGQSVSSPD